MGEKGWIKLHRRIQDCWIWDEKPFDKPRAWIDILLLANHADKKIMFNGNVICIKRGQYLTSIRKLSERWGWSYDKVSRFLNALVLEDMLRKESDSSRTLLTVINYEVYQDVPNADECTDRTQTSEPAEHQQVNLPNADRTPTSDKQELKELKNDKNVKNERNNKKPHAVYYPTDDLLNQTFTDYVEMRKQLKKPMTERAVQLAMNKLESLSGGDNDKAIKIIEQSIERSWAGLFELKEDKRSSNQQGGIDWDAV
jgi:hypothetical protein